MFFTGQYIFFTNTYFSPVDESNIFTADITETNKVGNVKFKKSTEYAVTGMSINQDINSNLVAVTKTDRQNVLRNFLMFNVLSKLVKK